MPYDGAVRLTLTSLCKGRGYGPSGDPDNANLIQAPPLPTDGNSTPPWLYFRFRLSLRDVEEILAHRGVDVSYETICVWAVKFGPKIAANLGRRKLPPSPRWHLDEMVSTIAGERVWIWRAVEDEGEVVDMIVQKRRDAGAALRLFATVVEKSERRARDHRH